MRGIYFFSKLSAAILILCLLGPKIALAGVPNGVIIISEIGAYETADCEWVEIYNQSASAVDLTGWKFYEEQTNHGLTAYQNDMLIEAGEYAIIANKPDLFLTKHSQFTGTVIDSAWSSLKESGEEVGLKDSGGIIIEVFSYLPATNSSLQKIDIAVADYTESNWQIHPDSDTAGRQNEFTVPVIADPLPEPDPVTEAADQTEPMPDATTEQTAPESPSETPIDEVIEGPAENATSSADMTEATQSISQTSNTTPTITHKKSAVSETVKKKVKPPIIINEIFPNPAGPDEVYEFIELKNSGKDNYEVVDWKIKTLNASFTIPRVTFGGGQIITFMRSQTNLALHNKKETVQLLDSANVLINSVKYDQVFEENISYQRFSNEWKQTARPTFGQENEYVMPDLPPVISYDCPKEISLNQQFVCDISDSFDPNGNQLSVAWKLNDKNNLLPEINFFGTAPEIKIDNPNYKNLSVVVSDGRRKSQMIFTFQIAGIIEDVIISKSINDAEILTDIPSEITPLSAINSLQSGTQVIIDGAVSKKIRENAKTLTVGDPEIKIMLTDGYWPLFEIGDLVTINGKTGRQNGEAIIRVRDLTGLIGIITPVIPSESPPDKPDDAKVAATAKASSEQAIGFAEAPKQSSHKIWYIIGVVILGLTGLYVKIKQFSPTALRINDKAGVE